MRVYAGTSGYSYAEWKGVFYPEKLPARDMLAHYASKLSTVEVNNTFYRMPRPEVVAGWAEAVPEGFRFALKASRRITHFARLVDAAEPTRFLLERFAGMGSRLGAILFQLPPTARQNLDALASFLAHLPAGTPAAFEFRHPSWLEDATYDCLRAHGAALVLSDSEKATTPVVSTATWTYLRLRRESYEDEELREWAARLGDMGWSEAFVYFKHEDAGAGPRAAARFLELVGEGE